ncbi:hypothetical protein [Methylobacterium oryzihabitans]|uniref:Uncharacterized protein n=1 Tax=Methylobacterium oryzihabitans TaxID=2499852 RepID=A0A3S2V7S0_9HYPH|nr:hypothetical protein [Methylobacterium oryzihabitans]RVU16399.1 hypothetical protein EOE48_17075 [Methylobacterium oryzihabitans]
MPVREGVVTIVQESRFQLVGDDGSAHLFILGRNAAGEADQLAPLQRRQARVRVEYARTRNLIGFVAEKISVCGESGR